MPPRRSAPFRLVSAHCSVPRRKRFTNKGPVYLTAPKSLHETTAFDQAFAVLRASNPGTRVCPARDYWADREHWRAGRDKLLTVIAALYVLVAADGRVGSGVAYEIAATRAINPAAPIRAFRVVQSSQDVVLVARPDNRGYPVAGITPELTPAEWDAAVISSGFVIFAKPVLSFIANGDEGRTGNSDTIHKGNFNGTRVA